MHTSNSFRLLETMRVSSGPAVFLLDRHMERLRGSAAYFGFECDPQRLYEIIMKAAAVHENDARLRVLLSRDGTCDLEFGALTPLPIRLRLSPVRVDSSDPFLYHKTTNRRLYEDARRDCDADTDVLLVNERGEATETTIANIAVWRAGQWVTPPVRCGLLPGVMRAELLESGELVEGLVPAAELAPGTSIRCFNSVRGVFDLAWEGK